MGTIGDWKIPKIGPIGLEENRFLQFAIGFLGSPRTQSDGSPSLDRVRRRADMQNPSESSQFIN